VEKSALFHIDSETGLRLLRPNAVQGRVKINEHGFRSPAISTNKAPTTIRLAFLGSSTTYDAEASTAKTWPHLVWQNLQERYPECTFDYLNAGIPGFGTRDQQRYFTHRISSFDPDIVFILTSDLSFDSRQVAKQQGLIKGRPHNPSWLAKHSVLWAKVEKNILVIRRQRSAPRNKGRLNTHPREFSDGFAQRLDAFVKAVDTVGPMVVLLENGGQLRAEQNETEQIKAANTALYVMPYMSVDGLLAGREEYNRVIRQVAKNNDAVVINGYDDIPGNTMYFSDSAHFRPPGSRLMAETVVNDVAKTGEFLALVERSCR